MGMFDFLKDAGENVIEKKQQQIAEQDPSQKAANAICEYIEEKNLGIENLKVAFSAQDAVVTLNGDAPNQDACEKAALAAGNIKGVAGVENELSVAGQAAQAARFHDVQSGETLSAIAKNYYGSSNQYMKIFEANKPMLNSPDRIYPGQKLRIPV
ncbi:peptidoglycan-binding protein LysM [Suttonella sp. R2A3]|uniref:peptidoglycan-binding protein LysM n=1 Tax=Suttonella sp. R2A3 TaxID=2908648 RepID=UPI001F202B7A|nr:peptidoglycan-binding protein LysM [Suttonella sp. R2A3]UJF24343.1 peptidoglycan-binding protein LysM [Suttonella sp. R2A3]